MEPSELLLLLAKSLEELGIDDLVTGSMASGAFEEPRFTNDIDVVIDLPSERVDDFCAIFPVPDFYVSPDAVRQAIRNRFQFNILHPATGLKIDVIIPKLSEFERSRRQRGRRIPVTSSIDVWFASPEDVILRKMEYYQEGGSEKHLRDIAGVLKIQAEKIDRAYLQEWATKLGVADVWDSILRRVGHP